jgi:TldD protein
MPHFLKCKVNSRSTQLFKGQKVLNKELAEKVLHYAQSTGADFAEIFVEDSFSSSISLEESLVEQASDYISRGAGVRVVFGDTTGFAHTTNLTESGLIKAAETARSVSKTGRDGSRTAVPLKDRVSSVPDARYDPSYFKSKAVEKLLLMDEVARSYDASISQVGLAHQMGH